MKRRIVKIVLLALAGVMLVRWGMLEYRIAKARGETRIPAVKDDATNRAAYYFDALQILEPILKGMPETSKYSGKDGSPFESEDAPYVRPLLGKDESTTALRLLLDGVGQPECAMPSLNDVFGYGEKFRSLARFLLVASCTDLHDDDQGRAIRIGCAALRIGIDVSSNGPDEQASVGSYVRGLGCRALAIAVTAGPLEEDTLRLCETELPGAEIPSLPRQFYFDNDRRWIMLKESQSKRSWLHYRFSQVVGFGYLFRLGAFSRIAYKVWGQTGPDVLRLYRIDDEWLNPFEVSYQNASLRLIRVGVAAQRYVRENGRLPESLEALVPQYLDAIPEDPILGGPLQSRSTPDRFTVLTRSRSKKYRLGEELTFELQRLLPSASGEGDKVTEQRGERSAS